MTDFDTDLIAVELALEELRESYITRDTQAFAEEATYAIELIENLVDKHNRERTEDPVALETSAAVVDDETDLPYCLWCENHSHFTNNCWSTHGANDPYNREIFRLCAEADRARPLLNFTYQPWTVTFRDENDNSNDK